MKTRILFTSLVTLALMTFESAGQTIIDVKDWYSVTNTAGVNITAGETSAPTIAGINHRDPGTAFGYFNPVTLADGQKLVLNFDVTYQLNGGATNKDLALIRFGLFQSSLPHASTSTESFGADRVATQAIGNSYMQNWSGLLVINPNAPIAGNPLVLYRKTGTGNSAFSSTGDGTPIATLTTTGNYSMSFEDGVARNFTLELERSGNDLIISGSYGTGTFSATAINAITDPKYALFDSFGFYAAASAGDPVLIDSLHFSNVTITVIPEPSTVSLLIMGSFAATSFAFRRSTAKKIMVK